LKRFLIVVALALAAASMTATALAARSHSVNLNGRVVGAGTQGSKSIALGTFAGSPLGSDNVVLIKSVVKSGKIQGTFVSYNSHGSISGTVTQTATPQADGSTKFAGTGKILRGTGSYNGGTGVVTFAGNEKANDPIITYKITGSVKY
jgi:hypothetical protein